ncbi:hypothetical protein [Jiulongibacter sp. NS-SX5]|uniref:hypothetical protein n=1 Tax=Jiulongibacter sp. NS-SX5 TaxID=3463854 RepID=UPI0040596730
MRITLLFILLSFTAFGQNVQVNLNLPSLAIMDIEPNSNAFNLSVNNPSEAGQPVQVNSTNSSKWINFSSAVLPGASRRVTAQLSGGTLSGLDLTLSTSAYSGAGAGALGSPAGAVILSGTTQTIIDNIGGAYTGDGVNNGYNLTYSLSIANYTNLRSENKTVTVLFTMMDN